jgi:hypothetical protein
MAFMDHGLPAEVADGILSAARVAWTFRSHDGEDTIEFTWDIGHAVTARSNGRTVAEWRVGDPAKATTSRRTVENSIRRFLEERSGASTDPPT